MRPAVPLGRFANSGRGVSCRRCHQELETAAVRHPGHTSPLPGILPQPWAAGTTNRDSVSEEGPHSGVQGSSRYLAMRSCRGVLNKLSVCCPQVVEKTHEKELFRFVVSDAAGKTTYRLAASTEEERKTWVQALKKTASPCDTPAERNLPGEATGLALRSHSLPSSKTLHSHCKLCLQAARRMRMPSRRGLLIAR